MESVCNLCDSKTIKETTFQENRNVRMNEKVIYTLKQGIKTYIILDHTDNNGKER